MSKRLVDWICRCGTVLHLTPCRARVRVVCTKACVYHRHAGGAQASLNRLTRVMFAHDYSEAEARIFLKGYTAGRLAANHAHRRHSNLQRQRVGTVAWEKVA